MKSNTKEILIVVMALILSLSVLSGCGTAASASLAPSSAGTESKTAPEPAVPVKVLLAVSFGTSYNDSRDLTIGGIEQALQSEYPDYEVRSAFTSQIIIDKLAERDNLEIDNVTQAMERLVADGIKEVIVQPTHVMSGYEYDDVIAEIAPYADKFDSLRIGSPLLTSDADYEKLAAILVEDTKSYNAAGTAICFMGHGTEHQANAAYSKLQTFLTDAGHKNYFIGTVEAEPSLEDVLVKIKESGAKKVVLQPLMVVCGDHANNDMAGDEEDSWKSIIAAQGYEVECSLRGLGQIEGVQEMFVQHAGAATPFADATAGASAARSVSGSEIADGRYPIDVTSSSAMFKIVDAQLTVVSGRMTAAITLSGDGYSKLYMGTGEQALADTEENYIGYTQDSGGAYVFVVPVPALDEDVDCAAWSKKKESWYDRTLVFHSAKIPADAVTAK